MTAWLGDQQQTQNQDNYSATRWGLNPLPNHLASLYRGIDFGDGRIAYPPGGAMRGYGGGGNVNSTNRFYSYPPGGTTVNRAALSDRPDWLSTMFAPRAAGTQQAMGYQSPGGGGMPAMPYPFSLPNQMGLGDFYTPHQPGQAQMVGNSTIGANFLGGSYQPRMRNP